MRFGLLSEGQVNKGMSYGVRLREVVEEAVFAEQMGFDFVGVSEQHFQTSAWSISAPEVVLGALAMRTSRIKLRHMSVAALRFNHPIRVAERIATLDLLTRGRIEVGTARSNNLAYLDGFGIDPRTTRADWREHVEVVVRALMEPTLEFHGDVYDIGPVTVVPKLESAGCPPLFVSATSRETHGTAGRLGMGVLTSDTYAGWEVQERLIAEYRAAVAHAEPIGGLYDVNDAVALLAFPAHCAPTRAQAIEEARPTVLGLLARVRSMLGALGTRGGPEYEYFRDLAEEMARHGADVEYLMEKSPMLMLGTPDDFVERLKVLERMGVDEIILKIDGYGHRRTMRSIELVGKYVIPEFKGAHAIPENAWEAMGVPGVERYAL